uniref:Signal transducing adapter molecule 1 n=2 Tax=Clytia hemisphaerica TaxID=252671 RepID=A0A7M5V4B0_9CNID|eukprot:TCONS_00048630-protein
MPKQVLETDIEKATSEYNVSEDWQVFMDICDRIKTMPNGPKDSLKCIMKRVNHQIPHVALQALTLLQTCVSNCGKQFMLEVSSRDWCNNAKNVITRGHEKVSQRLREMIKKWAEDEFKEDPQLALIGQFYKRLKQDGYGFEFGATDKPNSTLAASLVQTPKPRSEDDVSFKEDLELAIAMSLQTADTNQGQKTSSGGSSSAGGASSLYPTFSAPQLSYEETELFQVRALYDFEAAEDNEMTFKTGEIFAVLDNSDENWWKGKNHLGVGLFPANFVTSDLTPPESKSEKKVRFSDVSNDQPQSNQVVSSPQVQTQNLIVKRKTVIDENHLDSTLSMLKNASPNEVGDEEENIASMEDTCKEMGPLIEKKILETDRRKDDLGDLNDKFLQALQMYQQLMKEPMVAPQPPPPQPMAHMQQMHGGHMYHSMGYQQPHSLPAAGVDPNYQYQHYGAATQGYASLPPPQYQVTDPRQYQTSQQQPHSLDSYDANKIAKQQQSPAQQSHPSYALPQTQGAQPPTSQYAQTYQQPMAQQSMGNTPQGYTTQQPNYQQSPQPQQHENYYTQQHQPAYSAGYTTGYEQQQQQPVYHQQPVFQ